jgi:inactivated superfamily I helicase
MEKFEQALILVPDSPRILRHYAVSLAEQALFLKKTSTMGFGELTSDDLSALSEEKLLKHWKLNLRVSRH